MKDFQEFLEWEKASLDTIDVKKIYIDVAGGDLIAGLMLSQIIYWYLPDKTGQKDKLRVFHDNENWIAKTYKDWWNEIRISKSQAERAIRILVNRGIIEKKVFKFCGEPTTHIRILKDNFLRQMELAKSKENEALNKRNGSLLEQKTIAAKTANESCSNSDPLTETTTENNSKNTTTLLSSLNANERKFLEKIQNLPMQGKFTLDSQKYCLKCFREYGENKTASFLRYCSNNGWSWNKALNVDKKYLKVRDWENDSRDMESDVPKVIKVDLKYRGK
jgi:hypothetical protein